MRSWLRNGCPVVTESEALELIRNIEDQERFSRMGPKLAVGTVSDNVRDWWLKRFPEIPQGVIDFMVGQDAPKPEGSQLPWNRRQRKKFENCKGLIIHLFSGDQQSSKEWTKGWPPGIEVLTVDVAASPNLNLHDPHVWAYVCHLARNQNVVAVIGGPPCRSVSRLRNIRPGPAPLRDRVTHRFGLEGLSPSEKLMADGDAALVFKQLALYELATADECTKSQAVGFLLESPEDPAKYSQDDQDAPSYWAWPEIQMFQGQHAMSWVSFDQSKFGHVQRKPTTCLTNLPLMRQLDGSRDPNHQGQQLHSELPKRMKQTSGWAAWAPGLKQAIRTSLLVLCRAHGCGSDVVRKLLNADQWRQHILQGHTPYRRDCRACVLDMAAGKPHKRRTWGGSSSWSMGVDLVPMVKANDKSTGCNVRYMLVATVAVPKFESLTQNPDKVSPNPPVEPWGEGLEEHDMELDGLVAEEDRISVVNVGRDVAAAEPPSGDRLSEVDGVSPPSGDRMSRVDEASPPSGDRLKEAADAVDQAVAACSQPLEIKNVTLIQTVESRHAAHVTHALDVLLTRFKYMGLMVNRVHSDRAKEFLSHMVQRWAAAKGVAQTMTCGDDPSSNGRTEQEVNQLKRRIRSLLNQKGYAATSWPVAARYAAEERLRRQLGVLGVTTPSMLPFGSSVAVKRKRWHSPGPLAAPFVQGTLLCSSPMMSSGWVVRTDEGQVVHAREAVLPSPLGDQIAVQLAESAIAPIPLDEVPSDKKPKFRMFGKQKDPGHHSKVGFPLEVPGLVDPVPIAPVQHSGEAAGSCHECVGEPLSYSPSLAPSDDVPEDASGGEEDGDLRNGSGEISKKVGGNTKILGSLGETSVSGALGETVVSSALGETLVSSALGETVVSGALGETPVSSALGETPVSSALGETPVSSALGETPVSSALGETPVSSALGETPVSSALGETPVSSVLGETPVSGALGETVVSSALGETLVFGALGETVVSSALGETPVSSALGETVVSGALDGTSASCGLGVTKSIVRRVTVKDGFTVVEEYHGVVLERLRDQLNEVPLGPEQGIEYGEGLRRLQVERLELEESLEEMVRLEERNQTRVCRMATDGLVPENVHLGENGEVLQTVVVSLDHVRSDLQGWHQAMLSEYRSLTIETNAIEPVDISELEGLDVEYVPGKLVCSIKSGPNGGRKKCRSVICGNLASSMVDGMDHMENNMSPYASGADGVLTRATLLHAVQRRWGMSLVDVKTAFLLAPRPTPVGCREAVVIPPKILVQAGICKATERWRVKKALYGFVTSPARWAKHRDSTMKGFHWVDDDGCEY